MKALSFLSDASRAVCNAVSSCKRRLPSIQISTTAKVATVALLVLCMAQKAQAECVDEFYISDCNGGRFQISFKNMTQMHAAYSKKINFSDIRSLCGEEFMKTIMNITTSIFSTYAKCILWPDGRIEGMRGYGHDSIGNNTIEYWLTFLPI